MLRALLFLTPVVFAVLGRTALAQDSTRAASSCQGEIVNAIDVYPQPPTVIGRDAPAWRRVVLGVALQHVTTKPSVIRDLLLLEVGKPCTELRREESERILRAQPFIAAATIRATPNSAGRVRIDVETVDEIPTVLRPDVKRGSLSELTVGNRNVLGSGRYLAARWEQGFAYRDGWGVRFADYHALGGRNTFSVELRRDPLGSDVAVALGRAFVTNLQSVAWYAGYEDVERFVSFVRPEKDKLSLNLDRSLWVVGGVARIGIAVRRAFLGALITREHAAPAPEAVVITDSAFVADADSTLRGRFAPYTSFRVAGVLGLPLLSFTTVHGFDALSGAQDIASGVQLGLIVGRGVPRFGARDRDTFVSADVYAGRGSPMSLVALRVEGEVRQDLISHRWDAAVASGRLAWYLKPSDARTLIASAEFSGVWRERLPFQLTLGDRRGGVRGYRGSRLAGARRSVLRLEHRWSLGALTKQAHVGVAGFADAGKLWAGDVPFGRTTSVEASVGVGLLAAVPPRSQRLLRVDLAILVTGDAPDRWEIRVSSTKGTRMFWREPADVARARAGASPSRIFSWP